MANDLREKVIAAVDAELHQQISVEIETIIADATNRGLMAVNPERMAAEYRVFRLQQLAAYRSMIIDKAMWSPSGSRGVVPSAKVH